MLKSLLGDAAGKHIINIILSVCYPRGGTVEGVHSLVKEAARVHFASHGIPRCHEPH